MQERILGNTLTSDLKVLSNHLIYLFDYDTGCQFFIHSLYNLEQVTSYLGTTLWINAKKEWTPSLINLSLSFSLSANKIRLCALYLAKEAFDSYNTLLFLELTPACCLVKGGA